MHVAFFDMEFSFCVDLQGVRFWDALSGPIAHSSPIAKALYVRVLRQ
jgi:hypothetical protein